VYGESISVPQGKNLQYQDIKIQRTVEHRRNQNEQDQSYTNKNTGTNTVIPSLKDLPGTPRYVVETKSWKIADAFSEFHE
jgi:hypothetical protein